MEETLKEILNTLNKFDWVSFLLSLVTIIISLAAIIISVITQIKISKRDSKITLMETRLNFYTDCINTYDYLKGSLTSIFNPDKNTILKLMTDMETQENKLMKCANTCKFLFNDDKKLCETTKNLYLKFNKYKSLVFKHIIEEQQNNGFIKFIKSKKLDPYEVYSEVPKLLKLSKEFGQSKDTEVIEIAKDIENILSTEEFDNMFKKYINTK